MVRVRLDGMHAPRSLSGAALLIYSAAIAGALVGPATVIPQQLFDDISAGRDIKEGSAMICALDDSLLHDVPEGFAGCGPATHPTCFVLSFPAAPPPHANGCVSHDPFTLLHKYGRPADWSDAAVAAGRFRQSRLAELQKGYRHLLSRAQLRALHVLDPGGAFQLAVVTASDGTRKYKPLLKRGCSASGAGKYDGWYWADPTAGTFARNYCY